LWWRLRVQDILPISATDYDGLRSWQRLVAPCAGGQTSGPHVIIVPFLLVQYLLLILLDRLLPVLLIRGCCAMLRRCSRPSRLGGCFSRRYSTRRGDEATPLPNVGPRPLLLFHAFTLLSRGIFRLPQTRWACSASTAASPGKYPCLKECEE